jgi:hypothetical protein
MTDPDNWAEEDRSRGEILILAGLGMLISAFLAPFDLLNWWSDGSSTVWTAAGTN